MKQRLLSLSLALILAMAVWSLARADVDPDATRYDTRRDASWGAMVTVPADSGTVVWLGWEAFQGAVVRLSGDIQVEYLTTNNGTLTEGPSWQAGRSTPNPRAGSGQFAWSPDTLTSSSTTRNYCCGGLLGFRLTALGEPAVCRIYATGQGGDLNPMGTSAGAGGTTSFPTGVTVTDPDTALQVDQLLHPEDLGIQEDLLGLGVTLTDSVWTRTAAVDAREARVQLLMLSWSNDFTDSIQVVLRGHPTTASVPAWAVDLTPNGNSTVDSTLAWIVDTPGMTGGAVTLPLVDRQGRPVWLPYESIGFYKVGSGNVSTFKCLWWWRK